MLPECPPDLRPLLPYLQRASELRGREPIVAYYCGFYAAHLALAKGYPKSASNDAFLMALFDELEKEKRGLLDDPAMHDAEAGRSVILQFAMRIFLAADNEDRAGQSTKKTARLFLVASQFLEVARVLGQLPEEIEERIRYAKWKATDIVKALNEGRQPMAGPPGSAAAAAVGEEKEGEEQEGAVGSKERDRGAAALPSLSGQFPSSAGNPAATKTTSPPLHQPSPPIVLPSIRIPGAVSIAPTAGPDAARGGRSADSPPNLDQIMSIADAEKYARYAVSAIQFEDVATAIKNLERALNVLYNLGGRPE